MFVDLNLVLASSVGENHLGGMSSKLKNYAFKSYLNPLSNASPDSPKLTYVGNTLPMHLCDITSVQCDVVDTLKENILSPAFASMKKSKGHKTPLTQGHKASPLGPLSDEALAAAKRQLSKLTGKDRYDEPEAETPLFCSTPNHRLYVWDEQESETAPVSSWSTLPNRSLLCRPLPLDVGRCTCYVVREQHEGPQKVSVYSLYTDEGKGRQDRKLAVARHRRKVGRSEFVLAQSSPGTLIQHPDEGFLGTLSSNIIGSRYHIWDQGDPLDFHSKDSRQLLGVVMFEPTVATLTGDYRRMRVYIPTCQSMLIGTSGLQHGNGLTRDWEENMGCVTQLSSQSPYYNRLTKRYELDFRNRARLSTRIRSSVKNFLLTMQGNGKQVILLFGKIDQSTYVMEYSFPLTAYQAFSICLASIDSKLCCTV